jgi:hypothetical protein
MSSWCSAQEQLCPFHCFLITNWIWDTLIMLKGMSLRWDSPHKYHTAAMQVSNCFWRSVWWIFSASNLNDPRTFQFPPKNMYCLNEWARLFPSSVVGACVKLVYNSAEDTHMTFSKMDANAYIVAECACKKWTLFSRQQSLPKPAASRTIFSFSVRFWCYWKCWRHITL